MADNFTPRCIQSTETPVTRVTMDQATEDELFWSDVSVRKVTSGTQLKCFKEVGNVKGNLNSDGAVNSCTPMVGPRKSPSDELPSCHSTATYEHRDDQKVDVIEDEVIVSRAIVDLSIARAKQQFAREELATSVDSNINIDLFVKDYVQEVISGAILVYFGAQNVKKSIVQDKPKLDNISFYTRTSRRHIGNKCQHVYYLPHSPQSYGDTYTDGIEVLSPENGLQTKKVPMSRSASFMKLFRRKSKKHRARDVYYLRKDGTSEEFTGNTGMTNVTELVGHEQNHKTPNKNESWFRKLKRRMFRTKSSRH